MATDTLSIEDARRVALSAQGLRGARVTKGGVPAMVRRLGAVQLDTISVLARSHELVAYARLGAIGRNRVEQTYWGPKSETFEYWSHAACVLSRRPTRPLHLAGQLGDSDSAGIG
jgi:hypothetical protein